MRISDWSSDVCSSDLRALGRQRRRRPQRRHRPRRPAAQKLMRTIAPEGQGTTMSTIRLLVCVLLIAASGCQQQAAATAAQSMPSATEMLAAVDTGDIKTVRMLLEKGADPDARVRGDGTALLLAHRNSAV